MVSTILFDADGVLIHSEQATIELERKYGIPLTVSQEFFSKEWSDILTGKSDTKDKMAPYLEKWGWKGSVEDYQNFWFEFEHKLDQTIIDHIQELRNKGIACYVATNQDKYRATYMLEKMGFENSFDGVYSSAQLGEKKPSKEFFTKILTELKVSPQEVLFWDDLDENVTAAKDLGLNAEIFTDFTSYQKVMTETYGL